MKIKRFFLVWLTSWSIYFSLLLFNMNDQVGYKEAIIYGLVFGIMGAICVLCGALVGEKEHERNKNERLKAIRYLIARKDFLKSDELVKVDVRKEKEKLTYSIYH